MQFLVINSQKSDNLSLEWMPKLSLIDKDLDYEGFRIFISQKDVFYFQNIDDCKKLSYDIPFCFVLFA